MARQINVDADSPERMLTDWHKDSRLTPYGGANFGTPPEMLTPDAGLILPTDRFFVRSNGPVPAIDSATWRLRLSGHVRQNLTLTLAELQALPHRTLTAFLECAGNSRTRFDPLPEGTPWKNDAIGNAEWEGVSLGVVLDLAGVGPDAVDVVAQGGDFPEMRRGLPLAVARDPDTLLVWRMNGADLPIPHGGPVRLFVPGWAGIASTKWLVGLEVIDRAFDGFWNADNYVFWTAAREAVRPIREMPPKSIIVTPLANSTLPPGPQTVSGFAWSGHGRITTVEISTDGGESWREASLTEGGRRAWVRFDLPWQAEPGVRHLRARATDERGLTQPITPEWNAKGYLMNAIDDAPIRVSEAVTAPNGD